VRVRVRRVRARKSDTRNMRRKSAAASRLKRRNRSTATEQPYSRNSLLDCPNMRKRSALIG